MNKPDIRGCKYVVIMGCGTRKLFTFFGELQSYKVKSDFYEENYYCLFKENKEHIFNWRNIRLNMTKSSNDRITHQILISPIMYNNEAITITHFHR